jgi:hypothetical protein
MPKMVAKSRPPTNDTPIIFRAVEYTPEANTSGNIPRIEAKAVISMGLTRIFAALMVASIND